MPRIEQAGYPYIEGSHGIPFDQVTPRKKKLVAGSGKVVYPTIKRLYIDVASFDKKHHMIAMINTKGNLILDLRTKITVKEQSVRHTDFFAGRFVDFALTNFELNGQSASQLLGDWRKGSLNYGQFMHALNETGDLLAAARGTWTGQIASRHGLEIHSENNIAIPNPERILVEFTK